LLIANGSTSKNATIPNPAVEQPPRPPPGEGEPPPGEGDPQPGVGLFGLDHDATINREESAAAGAWLKISPTESTLTSITAVTTTDSNIFFAAPFSFNLINLALLLNVI